MVANQQRCRRSERLRRCTSLPGSWLRRERVQIHFCAWGSVAYLCVGKCGISVRGEVWHICAWGSVAFLCAGKCGGGRLAERLEGVTSPPPSPALHFPP